MLSDENREMTDRRMHSLISLTIGPGQLTRSMYLAGAKKIVTIENADTFQSSLKVRYTLFHLLFTEPTKPPFAK